MNLSHYSPPADFSRGASWLKEALWGICKGLFFLPWWPVPSSVRVMFLRAFGAEAGQGVVIRSGVDISFPWRLSLGDHVWLGEGVKILSLAKVTVGSHVCISQQAFLCTGSHDHEDEKFALIVRPITVDSEVWIAARAFVAPGVHIGTKSVVGACAVVLTDVPPSTFAAENPARMRSRS